LFQLESLRSSFVARFGQKPRIFSAPGRVNLIGEHTDYNDGFVLPMAIDRRTYVAAAKRSDRVVRVWAENVGEERQFDLDRPAPGRRGSFIDYVEGTAQALKSRGAELVGADLVVSGDIPTGAGLSSSAALEISTGLAMLSLADDHQISRVDLARAGQSAEHTYVGILCGIMDQFIASLGHADHALLIDCRSLEARSVPLALPGAVVLICDTRVKHQLASSEYNKRRAECQRGVELIRATEPNVRALRDVSISMLERHAAEMPEVVRRRCRHVVTEDARTLAAAEALERNELPELGRLMFESHRSLRDDYEVSCPELDLCVDLAQGVPGVYGARMTGGGFGGCTVNVVAEKSAQELSDVLAAGMQRRFGKAPEIFTSRAGEGAVEHI
jgi:galactokinase